MAKFLAGQAWRFRRKREKELQDDLTELDRRFYAMEEYKRIHGVYPVGIVKDPNGGEDFWATAIDAAIMTQIRTLQGGGMVAIESSNTNERA